MIIFPNIEPNSGSSFSLQSNTRIFESTLTRDTQTVVTPGSRWAIGLVFKNLNAEEQRKMLSFFAQCQGMAGRFLLYDHARPYPRGTATGTPLINGADQTGRTLATDGWSISSNVLLEGDYFSVVTPKGRELKIITEDIASDASGEADLKFSPALRNPPSDNAAITTDKPQAVFRLTRDDVELTDNVNGYADTRLDCVENFHA